jgi:hypothetical protein
VAFCTLECQAKLSISYRNYLASLSIESLNQFAGNMSKAEALCSEIARIYKGLACSAPIGLNSPAPSKKRRRRRNAGDIVTTRR